MNSIDELNMSKELFPDPYLSFLKLLNKHAVTYMIVGGYAVNFHGYNRVTGDMDVWVDASDENKKKLLKAIDEYGYEIDPLIEMNLAETTVFNFGGAPYRIEILSSISGVKFNDAYQNRVPFMYLDLEIPFLNLKDLLQNKIVSARYKDWDDYEKLSHK